MSPIQCAYCGDLNATTRDHVPPKLCFPEPRPSNLITVPACAACNHGFSKSDELFGTFQSLILGTDTPETRQLHETNKRRVKRNNKLRALLLNNAKPVLLRDDKGVTTEATAINWEPMGHNEMIERIIRGLFFRIFERPLTLGTSIKGSMSKPPTGEYLEMWQTFPGENIGENGEFRYRFNFAKDAPENTIWMMMFFDRHFAMGSTGPDE